MNVRHAKNRGLIITEYRRPLNESGHSDANEIETCSLRYVDLPIEIKNVKPIGANKHAVPIIIDKPIFTEDYYEATVFKYLQEHKVITNEDIRKMW